ncbi:unnamed protein product, partial [marine sediment metagenome]
DQFKQGVYNVLVSTNVGEEGLDIAECDLVVFYDVVASEIRLIQRKGRTARHRKGRVVILYCKGTHDEVYLRIALSKLKKMNVNLKNPQQLKESYNEEYVPENGDSGDNFLESSKVEKLERPRSKHQSKLYSFMEPDEQQHEPEEEMSEVKISKLLPMKFGIRKKLEKDHVDFKIVGSDLHIVIFNKVLIQIYNPRHIIENESFISENQELAESERFFMKLHLQKLIDKLKDT